MQACVEIVLVIGGVLQTRTYLLDIDIIFDIDMIRRNGQFCS